MIKRCLLLLPLLFSGTIFIQSQSSPMGMPVLDDYLRRQQLLGDSTLSASLMIRPLPTSLMIGSLQKSLMIRTMNASTETQKPVFEYGLMPVVWKQRYTSDHPLSLNDGAMIGARGYQTLMSAGVYARVGILSVQLMPEWVYAENRPFDGFPVTHPKEIWTSYNNLKSKIDLPDRFGEGAYQRFHWGQSSVRLNYKALSVGLSNENLWWGPGQKNALMMSNNAPGFMHLTFNSTRPVNTPIGSFEWQLVGGRLNESGYPGLDTTVLKSFGIKPRVKRHDWRYYNALTVNYQPRWFPGLSLGGARAYSSYSGDMSLKYPKQWIPVFNFFFKDKVGGETADPGVERDQVVSVWARWLLAKEHAEVYFEYGRGDHNWHLNDILMEPDHVRAYIIGLRKLVPLNQKRGDYLDFGLELTQLGNNVNTFLRTHKSNGAWNTHGAILHGYTNQGQIMGAGIGVSSSMQVLNMAWARDKKRIGLELYRLKHDDDFWSSMRYAGFFDHRTHWVDISGAVVADWDFGNFLMNLKLQTVGVLNYMFLYDPVLTEPPYHWDYGRTRYNFNAEIGVAYVFNR